MPRSRCINIVGPVRSLLTLACLADFARYAVPRLARHHDSQSPARISEHHRRHDPIDQREDSMEAESHCLPRVLSAPAVSRETLISRRKVLIAFSASFHPP